MWTWLLRRLALAHSVGAERAALGALDRRLAADIGLTLDAARREAGRAPWDLPAARLAAAPPADTGRPVRRDEGLPVPDRAG